MGAGKQAQPTEYICLLSPLAKGLEPFLLTNKLGEKGRENTLGKTSTNDRALPQRCSQEKTLHTDRRLRLFLAVDSWEVKVRAAVDELKRGQKALKESSKKSVKYNLAACCKVQVFLSVSTCNTG